MTNWEVRYIDNPLVRLPQETDGVSSSYVLQSDGQWVSNAGGGGGGLSTQPSGTLFGNNSGSEVAPSSMSAADARTVLNVENGSTADQSDSEIETAYNNQVAQVSAGEITAGTSTSIRRYTPS